MHDNKYDKHRYIARVEVNSDIHREGAEAKVKRRNMPGYNAKAKVKCSDMHCDKARAKVE